MYIEITFYDEIIEDESIPSASLGPLYLTCSPFLKMRISGYPWTPYFSARSLSLVASTFPIRIGLSRALSLVAAFSNSGASFLQCPHLEKRLEYHEEFI